MYCSKAKREKSQIINLVPGTVFSSEAIKAFVLQFFSCNYASSSKRQQNDEVESPLIENHMMITHDD